MLGDLVNLHKHKIENQYLRGLVFQLYENNGVVKRSEVDQIVKSIPAEERKKLMGLWDKNRKISYLFTKNVKTKSS